MSMMPKQYDRAIQLTETVVGIDYSDSSKIACALTSMRYRGGKLIVEKVWEISRQILTQAELDQLPHLTKVIIVWATGRGPWEYELRKTAGKMYAGYSEYPIGNVGNDIGKNMIWVVA